jgi:hypothetical protein
LFGVRYGESTDGGKTWGSSIQVTDTPTNLNYEQFGGRLVPFFELTVRPVSP